MNKKLPKTDLQITQQYLFLLLKQIFINNEDYIVVKNSNGDLEPMIGRSKVMDKICDVINKIGEDNESK